MPVAQIQDQICAVLSARPRSRKRILARRRDGVASFNVCYARAVSFLLSSFIDRNANRASARPRSGGINKENAHAAGNLNEPSSSRRPTCQSTSSLLFFSAHPRGFTFSSEFSIFSFCRTQFASGGERGKWRKRVRGGEKKKIARSLFDGRHLSRFSDEVVSSSARRIFSALSDKRPRRKKFSNFSRNFPSPPFSRLRVGRCEAQKRRVRVYPDSS